MGAPTGNQNASKKRLFDGALNRAIAQDEGKKLRQAAEKLLELAAAGESWAVKELADRLDGKPLQTVAGTGEDGEHLISGITVTLVKSGAPES